ncbi:mannose-6-phosphate isomerase-like protein (cupin superfamily) [Silvimonas terrae]|uniref:Mannose-6-phosphate isomerase-like protein (Cupin superfamily) n=1 Tax=Silvimonas terrae TaxID=300266 RepID=A0A840RLR9_9NEIS|nr:cupin domain-containing protein [Silvimonas terrae]MBB5193132.1 mannose-6-phosphate isomerase-like protein (cupin superfamily) [Silvimonas terrae]
MTGKISTTNAPHYHWGAGEDGWHLVRTPELSVIQERIGPGGTEARHYHEHASQFFYVLSGQLEIELAGAIHTLQAQEGLVIPPGVTHQVRNVSQTDAHFLVTSSPPSHGDRILA